MFIELDDVSKTYGRLKAVDRLSFKVEEGDIYGFLGPNGSGKSTTIRMILSLIKPTSGSIRLFGREIKYGERNVTLNRIGALIETPDFYNYLTARKNLMLLGQLSGLANLEKRIDEVLDIVGLSSRKNSRVRTFSRGMKQRLGIAQALLHGPELIILDEPTSGLDPQGQKEIRALIQSLSETQKITILISSHQLFEIEQIANRMIIINRGRAIVKGSVDELINSSEQHVHMRLTEPGKAITVISNSRWKDKLVSVDGDKLILKLSRKEIPELNALLVNSGNDIFALEPVRSLEDYFLQITRDEESD